MLQPNLVLRLMIEVDTAAEAEAEVRAFAPRIEAHAAIERHTVQQYWKIPEDQDVTLYLRPHGAPEAAFDALVALAEAGWTGDTSTYEDRWAVWNPEEGATLLSPKVVWAHLQLWYADPDAPPLDETEFLDVDAPP